MVKCIAEYKYIMFLLCDIHNLSDETKLCQMMRIMCTFESQYFTVFKRIDRQPDLIKYTWILSFSASLGGCHEMC